MTEKTYGAYGLIEYEMTLLIGSQQVRANFGGGSISQHGIVPATYSTANPIVQHAIEHSRAWLSGRIRLVRSVEKEGVAPGGIVATREDRKPEDRKPEAPEESEVSEDSGISEESEPKEADDTQAGSQPSMVKVACIEDAVEHLRKLGYKASKLTTEKAVQAAAEKEGIEFVYDGE